MKPWIPGVAAAALIVIFYPSRTPLSQRWSEAISTRSSQLPHADSGTPLDRQLLVESMASNPDSLRIPKDPFGLPPEPVEANPGPAVAIGPALPTPPRRWSATGRVGERSAVLSTREGGILVVQSGDRVDSAVVVSIGSAGIVLEDRAGQFVLRIP